MVTKTFEIDEYKVRLTHALKAKVGGIDIEARGIISCYGEGMRLIIYFLTEKSPVPDPFFNAEKDKGVMIRPFDEIGPFVDLLRNEKPIYGHLDSDEPHYNSVTTSKEPVGEEEED